MSTWHHLGVDTWHVDMKFSMATWANWWMTCGTTQGPPHGLLIEKQVAWWLNRSNQWKGTMWPNQQVPCGTLQMPSEGLNLKNSKIKILLNRLVAHILAVTHRNIRWSHQTNTAVNTSVGSCTCPIQLVATKSLEQARSWNDHGSYI
jgi:hypothetical protein